MSRYLNVFEHYKHEASIPLENNLTRVFARILNDNYYVASSFFNLIDEKLVKKGFEFNKRFDTESRIDVSIQKKLLDINNELVSDLRDDEKKTNIIGIALTAKIIDWKKTNEGCSSKDQIPDITIVYNGNIYIVEVKKTEEDCQTQWRSSGEKLKHNTKDIIKLTNSNIVLEDNEKINEYVSRDVSKDLSIELCIKDYIKLSELVKLDGEKNIFNKNMSSTEDKVAQYIYQYVTKNLIYQK